jgi:hypothetical protein
MLKLGQRLLDPIDGVTAARPVALFEEADVRRADLGDGCEPAAGHVQVFAALA